MIGAAAIGFACLAYAYLTLPDVRPLRTTNPSTTARKFVEAKPEPRRGRGRRHECEDRKNDESQT